MINRVTKEDLQLVFKNIDNMDAEKLRKYSKELYVIMLAMEAELKKILIANGYSI